MRHNRYSEHKVQDPQPLSTLLLAICAVRPAESAYPIVVKIFMIRETGESAAGEDDHPGTYLPNP